MTSDQFDAYKVAVYDRYAARANKFNNRVKSGVHYNQLKLERMKLLLLAAYTDMLDEYDLPTTEDEEKYNFFTSEEFKNIVLKINHLTGLRYNYDFKTY